MAQPETIIGLMDTMGTVRYGDFWSRVCAHVIDCLILSPLIVVHFASLAAYPLTLVGFTSIFIATEAYYLAFLAYQGATPGKRIMKLKVVNAHDLSPIGIREAIARRSVDLIFNLGRFSLTMVVLLALSPSAFEGMPLLHRAAALGRGGSSLLIGIPTFLWTLALIVSMLSNDKKRATHDFIAGTVVIDTTWSGATAPVPKLSNASSGL